MGDCILLAIAKIIIGALLIGISIGLIIFGIILLCI